MVAHGREGEGLGWLAWIGASEGLKGSKWGVFGRFCGFGLC